MTQYTREEMQYEGELYEGERDELLEWHWHRDRAHAKRMTLMLGLLGAHVAACVAFLGLENFRLGLGPDILQQHGGSLALAAIGFVGYRLCRVTVCAMFEGLAIALFIFELFGGVAAFRGVAAFH